MKSIPFCVRLSSFYARNQKLLVTKTHAERVTSTIVEECNILIDLGKSFLSELEHKIRQPRTAGTVRTYLPSNAGSNRSICPGANKS